MLLATVRLLVASNHRAVIEFINGLMADAVAVKPADERRISLAVGLMRGLHGLHGVDYTQWLHIQLGDKRLGFATVLWFHEKLQLEGGAECQVRYLKLTIQALRTFRARGH